MGPAQSPATAPHDNNNKAKPSDENAPVHGVRQPSQWAALHPAQHASAGPARPAGTAKPTLLQQGFEPCAQRPQVSDRLREVLSQRARLQAAIDGDQSGVPHPQADTQSSPAKTTPGMRPGRRPPVTQQQATTAKPSASVIEGVVDVFAYESDAESVLAERGRLQGLSAADDWSALVDWRMTDG